jgi:hypothetical protein
MLKIMAARVTAFRNIAAEEGSQFLRGHTWPASRLSIRWENQRSSVDWYARASIIAVIIYIDRTIYMQMSDRPLIARIDIQSIKNYVNCPTAWYAKQQKRLSVVDFRYYAISINRQDVKIEKFRKLIYVWQKRSLLFY